jgi:hypothetical protein
MAIVVTSGTRERPYDGLRLQLDDCKHMQIRYDPGVGVDVNGRENVTVAMVHELSTSHQCNQASDKR